MKRNVRFTPAAGLLQASLDLLYPPVCPLCGKLLSNGMPVCPDCRKLLPVVPEPRCIKCGRPVGEGEPLCESCSTVRHVFDSGHGVFLYEGAIRSAVGALKYHGEALFGISFGELLYEHAKPLLEEWAADCLVPVPLHPGRLRTRGYNQAERIAEGLSLLSGLPVRTDLIRRVRATHALRDLTAAERRAALHDAFLPGAAAFSDQPARRVILIDDIYTTGSTIDAAAEALREGGAEHVFFLTVCIGRGYSLR